MKARVRFSRGLSLRPDARAGAAVAHSLLRWSLPWLCLVSLQPSHALAQGAGESSEKPAPQLPQLLPLKAASPSKPPEVAPAPGAAEPQAPAPSAKPTANLNLEWEEVAEAAGYELKLTSKEGGESLVFPTAEASFNGRVPVGIYKLQVRSKDKQSGYFGKWSAAAEIEVVSKVIELLAPKNDAVLAQAQSRRSPVTFEWTPVAEARAYTLKLWSDDPTKVYDFQSRAPSLSLNLLTAREYHWQVTFESKARIGYHASPQVFHFKLLGPQLLTPLIDPKLGLPTVEGFSWSASPEAQSYEGKLLRHALDETAWEPYRELSKTEATRWSFAKLPPGVYRAEIVAHATHRVSSEPGTIEFVVKPTVTELTTALESATRLTGGGATPVLAPIAIDSAAQPERDPAPSAPKVPAPPKPGAAKAGTAKPEAQPSKPAPAQETSAPAASEDELSLDILDN